MPSISGRNSGTTIRMIEAVSRMVPRNSIITTNSAITQKNEKSLTARKFCSAFGFAGSVPQASEVPALVAELRNGRMGCIALF